MRFSTKVSPKVRASRTTQNTLKREGLASAPAAFLQMAACCFSCSPMERSTLAFTGPGGVRQPLIDDRLGDLAFWAFMAMRAALSCMPDMVFRLEGRIKPAPRS
jgi:hypothetical protein